MIGCKSIQDLERTVKDSIKLVLTSSLNSNLFLVSHKWDIQP